MNSLGLSSTVSKITPSVQGSVPEEGNSEVVLLWFNCLRNTQLNKPFTDGQGKALETDVQVLWEIHHIFSMHNYCLF